MIWTLSAPLLLPFFTAIIAFLTRRSVAGKWVSLSGAVLHLGAALVLVSAVLDQGVIAGSFGGWDAPFGIALAADYLGAAMVVITGIIGVAVALYSFADISKSTEALGFHALFHLLLAGVTGAFLTADLFNLYVWFEVMLISSFGLLVIGGSKQEIDGAVKYVTLNLISTVMFLTGVGLLYGMTGTLNMADLHFAVQQVENKGLLSVVAIMFMVAFGVKAAVFPLFFWLPASYHTPSFSVSAVFAGLLTKVGVYALIRAFTLIFTHDPELIETVLLWVAVLTMVTGVLGAAAQSDFRRILSFHIISQIGYMVLGLALMTPLGLIGAVFYLLHHIIVKANLFLISGVANRIAGGTELARIGGLYTHAPLLAVLFLIPAFSLAGFPPLSGFWAKFIVIRASLELEMWIVAGAALFVGLLTVFSMTKIWAEAFWTPHPDALAPKLSRLSTHDWRAMMWPIIALAVMTVIIGLFPGVFYPFVETAADQLLNPTAYLDAVLGPDAVAVAQSAVAQAVIVEGN